MPTSQLMSRSKPKLRIAIMASGAGTTLQAVLDACESGRLEAVAVALISNNSHCGAVARAERHGVPATHISGRTHPHAGKLDRAIASELETHCPDIVLLAGYMKKLGPTTLSAFSGRIINTHPSLLPKYGGWGMYGSYVHKAVLAAGDDHTGVSVHLVDSDYDTGRVLAQREVPVESADTPESLARRVQSVERPFLVEVLQRIATGELALQE